MRANKRYSFRPYWLITVGRSFNFKFNYMYYVSIFTLIFIFSFLIVVFIMYADYKLKNIKTSEFYINHFIPRYKKERIVFLLQNMNELCKPFATSDLKILVFYELTSHIELKKLYSYMVEYKEIIRPHLIKKDFESGVRYDVDKVIKAFDELIDIYKV